MQDFTKLIKYMSNDANDNTYVTEQVYKSINADNIKICNNIFNAVLLFDQSVYGCTFKYDMKSKAKDELMI